jgi:hypothetical protein
VNGVPGATRFFAGIGVGAGDATAAGWATATGSSFAAVITANVVCGCRSAIGSWLVVG